MKRFVLVFIFIAFRLLSFAQVKDSVYAEKMKLPGVKMVTVFGKYQVWTQKIGEGKIKLLLLHGGPGNTHEYLESLANYLAKNGIEVYLYDQLGSYFSDQPIVVRRDTIWTMTMRVEEVNEVRKALGLGDFYLYGHSFGATLGLAYTHKYPLHVKGLIYSSMNTDSAAHEQRYAWVNTQVDSLIRLTDAGSALMKLKDSHLTYDNQRYQEMGDSVFLRNYLVRTTTTPEVLQRLNRHSNYSAGAEIRHGVYSSEEFKFRLADVKNPILLIAGDHDFTVSEKDLQGIHKKLVNSRLYICKNSGHMSMLDDADEYDKQVLKFLTDVEAKIFTP